MAVLGAVPREILQRLLVQYMQIDDSRVVFYNQEYDQPNDRGVYIIINTTQPEIVSVKTEFNPANNEETIFTTTHEMHHVDIFSKSEEAFLRKEEVVMSLYSQAAQNLANENGIRFHRPSNILDLSAVEGAGGLHRYRISVIISSVRRKTTPVDIYDQFRISEVVEDV